MKKNLSRGCKKLDSLEKKNVLQKKQFLMALLGCPLEHSVSPGIHKAGGKALGVDLQYLLFDIRPEDLEDTVWGIKALGFKGCNVTIPYKERILDFVDEKSFEVEFLGASNTLTISKKAIKADNTDWKGFLRDWEQKDLGKIEGKSAVILGSGGAAYAILFALAESGISKVYVFNRDIKRAEKMLGKFQERYSFLEAEPYFLSDKSGIMRHLKTADILINATPIGMYPYIDKTPIPMPVEVKNNLICYDLIYNPLKTRLVLDMEKLKVRALGGLGMLINQAALSFEIWTNAKPDLEKMKNAALKALRKTS